jgi:hypothetical protein
MARSIIFHDNYEYLSLYYYRGVSHLPLCIDIDTLRYNNYDATYIVSRIIDTLPYTATDIAIHNNRLIINYARNTFNNLPTHLRFLNISDIATAICDNVQLINLPYYIVQIYCSNIYIKYNSSLKKINRLVDPLYSVPPPLLIKTMNYLNIEVLTYYLLYRISDYCREHPDIIPYLCRTAQCDITSFYGIYTITTDYLHCSLSIASYEKCRNNDNLVATIFHKPVSLSRNYKKH